MAKRGPKTKTTAAAPIVPCSRDGWEPPKHLSKGAKEAWTHVVDLLASRGNLSRTDPTLVECYAVNVAILREAMRAIDKDGPMLEQRGKTVPHPASALINSATMRIKAIVNDLGLCPATSKYAASTGTNGQTQRDNKWTGLLGVTG